MHYMMSVSGKRFFLIKKRKGTHEKKSGNAPLIREKVEPGTVYSNEFVKISFDSASRVLFQEWSGFCPGDEFKAAIDAVFNYMTENSIYKTVCDVRYQRVVPPSCQKYVEEKVLNFIKTYGAFYSAFVVLEKSAGGICARLYDFKITQKLNYRINNFFNSVDEAESWLSEK